MSRAADLARQLRENRAATERGDVEYQAGWQRTADLWHEARRLGLFDEVMDALYPKETPL